MLRLPASVCLLIKKKGSHLLYLSLSNQVIQHLNAGSLSVCFHYIHPTNTLSTAVPLTLEENKDDAIRVKSDGFYRRAFILLTGFVAGLNRALICYSAQNSHTPQKMLIAWM